MPLSNLYYCVGCGRLEELGGAATLFHTGFYKVVHPLGCCGDCADSASNVKPEAGRRQAAALDESGPQGPDGTKQASASSLRAAGCPCTEHVS
ncbi:hypothetical protein IDH44_18200 [Paenibacillus sp. IB182496]|uniref:DUF3973 domain-containing protein n=1 Tax=Paenibacillus sabuli TaxID=2772509 RepID=A0A927BWY3_9BACL|nr:hypothetical protein [Paenibacillus sabuli]MBD2847135.1 hypothetical protein [Paenibacillus sabuli]